MRQNPWEIPSHFCPDCNKGLNSGHSLCGHRKTYFSSRTAKGLNRIEGNGVLPMIVTSSNTRKQNDEDLTDYTDDGVNNNEEDDGAVYNVFNTFAWKVDDVIRTNHCFSYQKICEVLLWENQDLVKQNY